MAGATTSAPAKKSAPARTMESHLSAPPVMKSRPVPPGALSGEVRDLRDRLAYRDAGSCPGLLLADNDVPAAIRALLM